MAWPQALGSFSDMINATYDDLNRVVEIPNKVWFAEACRMGADERTVAGRRMKAFQT